MSEEFCWNIEHGADVVVKSDCICCLQARITLLEAQELGFIQTLCVQSEEAQELRKRIKELEQTLQIIAGVVDHYGAVAWCRAKARAALLQEQKK